MRYCYIQWGYVIKINKEKRLGGISNVLNCWCGALSYCETHKSTLTWQTLWMTWLYAVYELSNSVYLFLWRSTKLKCARGQILLLLIAFHVNEKEFLAYCLLFLKWKEITSCIISLYIIGVCFFFCFFPPCNLLLLVSWSVTGAANGCCNTLHLQFVLPWCYKGGGWRERGGSRRRANPTSEEAAGLNTVWFLSLRSLLSNQTQIPGAVFHNRSVIIETACSSSSSPAKSFWVVNVSSWSYF